MPSIKEWESDAKKQYSQMIRKTNRILKSGVGLKPIYAKILFLNASRHFIDFDTQMIDEFLERHGIKASKLERAALIAHYEEIITNEPDSRPCFHNLRRNLLALVAELGKDD